MKREEGKKNNKKGKKAEKFILPRFPCDIMIL
jgi:hypothetical protein